MTRDQHAQVKELFLKAREVSAEDREEFLRRECGEDAALRHEVTSLLRHDNPATILARPVRTSVDAPARVGRPSGRLLGRIERATTHVLHQVFASPAKRLLVIVVALLLLFGLALWMYAGMKQATRSITASELRTILNADIKALELWIEEKKKDVRLWSSRAEIRQAVDDLARIAETEREPREKLLSAPALASLRDLLDKYDRIAGRPERDAVVTRDGLFLAADRDETVGMRLNTDGIAALVPVFQGQTLFFKPHPYGAFGIAPVRDLDTPVVLVVAPIHRGDSANSEIVAAAGFGFPADGEFTDILSVARLGQTGETYTFDENGLLLSESRFDKQLRASGLLPDDPESRSIFRIEIRDPGGKTHKRPASSIEAAARPLTRLAAEAIAAGRKGRAPDQEGVLLDAYRNYRGARVVGAWKWLPAYSFGVATEVEVDEQYAPMHYPLIAEWIRCGLLAGCMVCLLAAASWIAVLGRDVELARQLGQYTLQEKIGEGGMGVVYRARHALLQREAAIKLLRPETVNEESLARFEREVQLASSLTHPNTIDIFDLGTTPEGSFYCVMEFLAGRTLEDIVRSGGPLPAHRAINILRQIAGSLNEAHERGLVHRDIKPSNIMLCDQVGIPDFVKVLDFGLARTVERSTGSDVTQLGFVAGTPLYLAPERLTDPTTIDQRSDIYSFGAVGYYLLTGRHIYAAASRVDLLRQILNENPRRPSEVTSQEIPQELEDFIVCCLARRLEDRPATMQEVMTNIARIDTGIAQDNTGV
jgi:tRNA A-37 threonylcarbamoyl transferase component Bud32